MRLLGPTRSYSDRVRVGRVGGGAVHTPLVKTADNDADFFTKPMKPADFFRHRATLMNIKA